MKTLLRDGVNWDKTMIHGGGMHRFTFTINQLMIGITIMDKLLLIGALLIALLIAGRIVHFKLTFDQYEYACYWATKDLPHCADRQWYRTATGYSFINQTP